MNVMEEKQYTIIDEYTRYFSIVREKSLEDLRESDIVIFDLDGVLADVRHRIHYVDPKVSKKLNWDIFFEECVNDIPNKDMIKLLKVFVEKGYRIYILSGRSTAVKKETLEWFDYYNIPFDFMFLRPIKNYEMDYKLKKKWIEEIIGLEGKYKVFMVFDDNEENIEMFRNAGIHAFHVVINY